MPAMEYESEYGIEVINRFAGLDFEGDDPSELVQRAQQKEKALKADKKQAKARKGSAKTQDKAQTVVTKEVSIEDTKRDGKKIMVYQLNEVACLILCLFPGPVAATCFL